MPSAQARIDASNVRPSTSTIRSTGMSERTPCAHAFGQAALDLGEHGRHGGSPWQDGVMADGKAVYEPG